MSTVQHNIRCAYFDVPITRRGPNDCDCGACADKRALICVRNALSTFTAMDYRKRRAVSSDELADAILVALGEGK